MLTHPRLKNKCDRCNCAALKHVDFGLLIADALINGGRISAISYTPDHLNLCRTHLMEASIAYVHYAEYDLGQCPEYLMAA